MQCQSVCGTRVLLFPIPCQPFSLLPLCWSKSASHQPVSTGNYPPLSRQKSIFIWDPPGLMMSIVNIWFPTRNWPAAVQWPRLPTVNMPGAAAVLVTLLAAAGPHLYISISLVQLQPSCRASLHSAHTTIQPAATFYLDAVKYHICYISSRLICEYISFKIFRKNFHGQNKSVQI